MNHLLHVPLVLGLAAAFLPAQSLFTSQTTQSLGDGCNAVSTGYCKFLSQPTTLNAQFDASAGTVTLTLNAPEHCGATVPVALLALGTQPSAILLPAFGPDCVLHLLPILVLANGNDPFVLPLPPGMTSLTFLAQGAALSVDPVGNAVVTTSDALAITLQ
jgi:hypothetical protein